MKVYVEGELRTRSWEDESGTKKYKTEIKVNDMILLDSKGKTGAGGGKPAESEEISGDEVVAEHVEGMGEEAGSKKSAKPEAPKKPVRKSTRKEAPVKKEETKQPESAEEDILSDDLPF
jgi:single-strand DNA-binding protein